MNFSRINLNNFLIGSQLEILLQTYKYHESLRIDIELEGEQLCIAEKEITNFKKLISLDMRIIQKNKNNFNEVIKLVKNIKYLENLQTLHFTIKSTTKKPVFSDIFFELGQTLLELKNLKSFSLSSDLLTLTKEGAESISNGLKSLNNLIKLHYSLLIKIDCQIIQAVGLLLNGISQIQDYKIDIYFENLYKPQQQLDIDFKNFQNLLALEIKLSSLLSDNKLILFVESLSNLNNLQILKLFIILGIQLLSITKLSNCIFQLKNLEKLKLLIMSKFINDQDIIIGEKVSAQSKLKKLTIVEGGVIQNCRVKIRLGEDLLNIKNLTKLKINIKNLEQLKIIGFLVQQNTQLQSFKIKNSQNEDLQENILNFLYQLKSLRKLEIAGYTNAKQDLFGLIKCIFNLDSLERILISTIDYPYLFQNQESSEYLKNLFKLKELIIDRIQHSQDIILLGLSLKYIPQLIYLQIFFYKNEQFSYSLLTTIFLNFKYLVLLSQLKIFFHHEFTGLEDTLFRADANMIFSGIKQLTNLKELDIRFNNIIIYDPSYFEQYIYNSLQAIPNLHTLQLKSYLNQSMNMNFIIKKLQKLVQH